MQLYKNSGQGDCPNEPSGSAGNNTASASIVVNCPDVSVAKTADNSPINAGDTAAFTIVVSNAGPGTAYNVTVNDPLPAGVTWTISTAVTGCSISSAGVLSCSFATLAPGSENKITIKVSGATDAADCAGLSNTVTVSATNEAPAQNGNNSSTASITVNCPDVAVLKTADNSPINAGDTAAFTIVVSNAGPGTAYSVTLSDTLPSGITWKIDSVVPALVLPNKCDIASGVLSCSFGNLAAGASVTIKISGLTDKEDCKILSNTASVAASNEPADKLENNSSTATITVQCAVIELTKTANPAGPVSAGDTIGFIISVTNTGEGTASGVEVKDTLPANAGLSWTISGGTNAADCSINNGELKCNFGSLAKNEVKTVHISSPTTFASCATITNVATATSTNDGSDDDTASVTVNCPKLSVVKTADNATVNAGDNIGFTITVKNEGPGKAYGVTLSDTLPTGSGVSWSEDPDVAACSISAPPQVLSCSFGTLEANSSVSVHVKSATDAASCKEYNNTATANATNHPQVEGSAKITVVCKYKVIVLVCEQNTNTLVATDVSLDGGATKKTTLADQTLNATACSGTIGTSGAVFKDLTVQALAAGVEALIKTLIA